MAAGKAPQRRRSLALAAVLSMSLWFVSAAILPEIVAEGGLGPGRAAALSSAVQIGFVDRRAGAGGPRHRRPLRSAAGDRWSRR